MRPLVLTLVALLPWAAACSRDSSAYGHCATVFDCRTGQACVAGACAAGPTAPAGTYGVELIPASNTTQDPLRTEVAAVDLDAAELTLPFAEPVTFSGRVVLVEGQSANTNPSIGASITFTRASPIGLSSATYAAEAAADRAAGEVAFSLRLPPTTTATDADCSLPGNDCYEVRIVPANLDLFPPMVTRMAAPTSRVGVDLVLAGAFSGLRLTGTVLDAALRTGVGGLEVRVVDGRGRTVSSVKTTDAAGYFQVSVAPPTVDDAYWLQVGESTENPSVPRFFFAVDLEGGGDTDLGDLALLAYQMPVSVSYRVKGPATNGSNEPVEGALVRFTTFLGQEAYALDTPAACPESKCAYYSRQATTDANGEVTLDLIPGPGSYEVEVLPGPNSPYSAYRAGDVTVTQPGFASGFTLERKLEIRGGIVDAAGVPVAGATVKATPREIPVAQAPGAGNNDATRVTAQGLALDEAPTSIQSDAAGNFLLMLEAGVVYDVVITPAGGEPTPITTLSRVSFAQSGTMSIQLPAPALVAGTVSRWDGEDTSGTLVRLYEIVASGDPDTPATTAWLRGEAVATAGGEFKLLLPAAAPTVR